MYARLTTFRVKSDKFDDMRRWREENQTRIYGQPGLREWVGLMDEHGEFTVVAFFDDEQAARDSMPYVRSLWGEIAPMIEGEPTARFVEVMGGDGIATRGVVAA
ncbi:hypothetical protein [Microvirga sp. M2]|uniref:hypothetical protein n=1 Tax=Microvirga sp. M2 TaxID=3073270 RepID=UPI0039C08379